MKFRDQVIVPPSCPTLPYGQPFDLMESSSAFSAFSNDADAEGKSAVTEAFLSFSPQDEPDSHTRFVETASIIVPADSAMSGKLYGIAGEPEVAQALAKVLCERVAECRGVQPDGTCWALGAAGLREAVEHVAGPSDEFCATDIAKQ